MNKCNVLNKINLIGFIYLGLYCYYDKVHIWSITLSQLWYSSVDIILNLNCIIEYMENFLLPLSNYCSNSKITCTHKLKILLPI